MEASPCLDCLGSTIGYHDGGPIHIVEERRTGKSRWRAILKPSILIVARECVVEKLSFKGVLDRKALKGVTQSRRGWSVVIWISYMKGAGNIVRFQNVIRGL